MMLSKFTCLLLLSIWQYSSAANEGEACRNPNGETGICRLVNNCDILFNNLALVAVNSTLSEFWQKSRCNSDSIPAVCCPSTDINNINSIQTVENNKNLPDREFCGYQLSYRIFNGRKLALDEFPWLVLLKGRNVQGVYEFFCEGTLISARYVLTAAHCVTSNLYTNITARLGEHNTETTIDCMFGGIFCNDPPVDLDIEKITVHSEYNVAKKTNDIALLRVNKSIQYTDFIRPICLPEIDDEAPVGDRLTVAGWGKTEKASRSSIKLKVQVPKFDLNECKKIYNNLVEVSDIHICAGGEDGSDSCNGDSGSPLMYTTKKNALQWYIEGIVSVGNRKCGTKGWPGVYTRVLKYLSWISKNVVT